MVTFPSLSQAQKCISETGLRQQDQLCPISHTGFLEFTLRYSLHCGVRLTPHGFRRWISTYWHREGEFDMVAFTLRHSSGVKDTSGRGDALYGTYIAGLSVEEAVQKQKIIEKVLFNRSLFTRGRP
jgi:hypothetical protein